jgi:putative nucleotidyltransferase-like protein
LIEAPDHPVLVIAARYGLGVRTDRVALDPEAADHVVERARFHHLTGFLAAAMLDGLVIADDDVSSSVWKQWHAELLACVRLEALAVRTAELLDAAGIDWRLTKGAALAHSDYPDPSLRTFGDVDLVVHPADWLAAFHLLLANGYRREAPTLPGNHDDRYGKGATLTALDGLEVDLHRRFAIGRFGVRAEMEVVFGSSAAIELAGRTIPVLDPAGRLLHACFHAVLGGFQRLRGFRDVAQLILVTGADWETTFGVARSWNAEAVVAYAIQKSWDRLELDVQHPAHARAKSTALSRGDQRVLRLFAGRSTFRSQALTGLRRLPPHDIARYLWNLSRPRLRRQP